MAPHIMPKVLFYVYVLVVNGVIKYTENPAAKSDHERVIYPIPRNYFLFLIW